MQSRDGGIYFGSGIDTRQFNKDVEDMRKKIIGLGSEVGADADFSGMTDRLEFQKTILDELKVKYKDLRKEIDKMVPGVSQQELVQSYRKIGVEIEREKKSLKDLEAVYESFGGAQVSVMKKQRDLRYELEEMATQGKQNTAEFHALLQELEGFDKARNTVAAFQQSMKRGNVGVQAFTGSLRAGTGAFTAFTGVMALFSAQNERLVELQTRLQSVMAISIGVEQTHNALLKEGRLIQSIRLIQMRASTKAQALQTSSTIGATIAQRAFNLVAKANPYVLLAAAILSVVGALALLTKGQRKAVEEQNKINKSVAESTSGVVVQFSLLREEWSRLGGDIDRQNKFIKDRKGVFDSLGISINDITDAENAFVNNSGKVVNAMVARAKGAALASIAEDTYKNYLEQIDKEEKEEQRKRKASALRWAADMMVDVGKTFFTGFKIPVKESTTIYGKFLDQVKKSVDLGVNADDILKSLGLGKALEEVTKKEKKEQKKAEETFKQGLDRRRGMWEDYYKAVNAIGKASADKIYGDDLNVNAGLVDELEEQVYVLKQFSDLTQDQVSNLNMLNDAIRDLTGAENPFEKQKRELEESLEGYDTYTEKIEVLKKALSELGNTLDDSRTSIFIKDEIKKVEGERQKTYDAFVKMHQDYADKLAAIDKKRTDLLAAAKTVGGDTSIIEEQIAIEKYDAYIDMVKKKYNDLDKVFSDIESLTKERLIIFREVFENELAKTDDIAKKTEIGGIIKNINEQLEKLDSSPLKRLADDFKNAFGEVDKATKVKSLIGLGRGLKDISSQFKGAFEDIGRSAEAMGVEMDSVFGDVIKAASRTMDAISQIGEGMDIISKGVASGNQLQVAVGVAKSITGASMALGAWIDMGTRAGKESKRLSIQLKELEDVYANLQERISKTSIGNLYSTQVGLIENLQKQQEVLGKKMQAERKKWFNINIDDIIEWDNQIKQIDKEIQRVIDDIAKGVLSTDARSLSQQLGDALVDAFERGEDAAEALNKTVDDVFKQMVRNMIAASIEGRVGNIFNDIMRSMGIDPKTGMPIGQQAEPTKLSPEDQKKYRKQLREAAESQQAMLDNYRELFQGIVDLDEDVRPDGLRGAIKGMTQETADILAGQFNAIRMDSSGILTILRKNESKVDAKLIYLGEIGENTSGIYKEIKDLNSKIKEGDIRSSGL